MIKYTIEYVASLKKKKSILKNTDSHTQAHFVSRKLNIFLIQYQIRHNEELNNVFENIKSMNLRCLMFDSVKAVSMAKTFVFLEFPEEEKKSNHISHLTTSRTDLFTGKQLECEQNGRKHVRNQTDDKHAN